jgi:phosphatidylserine/phosphatidylglycerophosphate/cardiolipin synthase-like enzyme
VSKEASGWLITADSRNVRTPLEGYWVSLTMPGSAFGELAKAKTGPDGAFRITNYRGRGHILEERDSRTLRIVVKDNVGREIRVVSNPDYHDVSDQSILFLHDIQVDLIDAMGPWVTHNSGHQDKISQGKVTFLMDQDAFAYAADMITRAKTQILMSQLMFAFPEHFAADAAQEKPVLIFDFHPPASDPTRSPGFDLDNPRAAGVGDSRPERMLISAANTGTKVRVLIHEFTVPLFLKIVAGVLLFPFTGTYSISIIKDLLSLLSDTDEAKAYFAAANASNVRVEPFKQPVFSAGVMHPKLLAVDGRVMSIGSPFSQAYVDGHDHRIDSWIRGEGGEVPRHDAGFAVTGPIAVDLYRTMKLFWDTAVPDDVLPDLQGLDDPPPDHLPGPEPPPSLIDRDPDGICDMQVVRTLSQNRFAGKDEGEKGILEAYLRGIAEAEDFIYLENQYFTDDVIATALVERLRNNPKLQVILLVNIAPDTPTYPFKQRRLITRMRRAIRKFNTGEPRFGVFTRWRHQTHEVGETRPRMMPVYLHAKVGIIDNNWATVGSANLDGLSLDASLPSDVVRGINNFFNGSSTFEQRAIEVNALMLDDGSSKVADILRRKLWAEHLGFLDANGKPILTAPLLQEGSRPSGPNVTATLASTTPSGGWLKLWHDRANDTLTSLRNTPSNSTAAMASFLPWPDDNSTHKTPRDYLTTLGIRSDALVPIKGTRKFDFKAGDWVTGSKAAMDYD